MSIAAAILLIGASGTATRAVVVEDSLPGIVGRVILGGVNDVALPMWLGVQTGKTGSLTHDECVRALQRGRSILARCNLTLRIDGEPRTGWAWGVAACRVAGYAADFRTGGSVEYAYRLRVRGLDIRRTTRIENGRVSLLTDVWGSIGPHGELDRLRLQMDGVENGDVTTTVTATLTGHSTLGKRCWVIHWISDRRESLGKRTPLQDYIEREIQKAMQDVLGRIQSGGTDWYRAGGIAEGLR